MMNEWKKRKAGKVDGQRVGMKGGGASNLGWLVNLKQGIFVRDTWAPDPQTWYPSCPNCFWLTTLLSCQDLSLKPVPFQGLLCP